MVKTLLILYSVISVWILAYIAAQVFSIKVYITEDRFIYKKWFLLQKVLDIELSKIDSIQVSRWLIGLFVKVGNIKVSWGWWQITRIRYIINPAELRNVIHKQKQ